MPRSPRRGRPPAATPGRSGPKDGGVYPAGDGFGQNFPGGKIFFTPATGAHIMTGAILDKYMSLGGPADGDLGFPTIDEGAGKAPDSRNTTFSAADNPVIFWTPDTGARVVRGPINAAWDKLGGSAGQLGVPTDDETYRGNLVTQKFTGGELTYDRKAKTFTTVPPELAGQLAGLQIPDDPASAINAARRAAGGPLGPLGAAQGEPYPIGADGLGQNFAGGKIFYSPATGANVVTGQVLAKYESVGGPQGDLGLPTSSEVDGGLATESRMSTFCRQGPAGHLLDARLRRRHRARRDERRVGQARRRNGFAGRTDGRPDRERRCDHPAVQRRRDLLGPIEEHVQHRAGEPGGRSWPVCRCRVRTCPRRRRQRAGVEHQRQQVVHVELVVAACDRSGAGLGRAGGLCGDAQPPPRCATTSRSTASDDDEFGHGGPAAFGRRPGARAGADTCQTTTTARTPLFSDRRCTRGLRRSGDAGPTSGAASTAPQAADDADCGNRPSRHRRGRHNEAEPVAAQESDDAAAGRTRAPDEDQEDPDSVDTAPTRVPTPVERDPLTDTGRHARIEIDEPAPNGTALHLPLDDPNEAPEGYPIKADTKSGLYWAPGSTLYDDARAEIWFVSEELARTNGFVRAN